MILQTRAGRGMIHEVMVHGDQYWTSSCAMTDRIKTHTGAVMTRKFGRVPTFPNAPEYGKMSRNKFTRMKVRYRQRQDIVRTICRRSCMEIWST